jgi:putative addiction module component (TIGR02574 family)
MSTGTITSFDKLVSSALALPPEQRVELAERLWLSIEETDEALIREVEKRDTEMESGAVKTYTHEEVMRDARQAIGG